jgi:hypothetical protein
MEALTNSKSLADERNDREPRDTEGHRRDSNKRDVLWLENECRHK